MIQDVLSDKELLEKYSIKEKEIKNLTTSPPYKNKIIEVIATIINENDNNLSESQIYRRIKNIHKI